MGVAWGLGQGPVEARNPDTLDNCMMGLLDSQSYTRLLQSLPSLPILKLLVMALKLVQPKPSIAQGAGSQPRLSLPTLVAGNQTQFLQFLYALWLRQFLPLGPAIGYSI